MSKTIKEIESELRSVRSELKEEHEWRMQLSDEVKELKKQMAEGKWRGYTTACFLRGLLQAAKPLCITFGIDLTKELEG